MSCSTCTYLYLSNAPVHFGPSNANFWNLFHPADPVLPFLSTGKLFSSTFIKPRRTNPTFTYHSSEFAGIPSASFDTPITPYHDAPRLKHFFPNRDNNKKRIKESIPAKVQEFGTVRFESVHTVLKNCRFAGFC